MCGASRSRPFAAAGEPAAHALIGRLHWRTPTCYLLLRAWPAPSLFSDRSRASPAISHLSQRGGWRMEWRLIPPPRQRRFRAHQRAGYVGVVGAEDEGIEQRVARRRLKRCSAVPHLELHHAVRQAADVAHRDVAHVG